jgi:hypothetical protein
MKPRCKHLKIEDNGNDSICELSWGGELCDSMENPGLCEDYEEE